MFRYSPKRLLPALFISLLCGVVSPVYAEESVNVYSARKEALILPLLERFSAETGIKVNLITGKADELLKRIEIEGEASPADVFITVDVGNLENAKAVGILQPLDSAMLTESVPAHLRDRDNQWFGLSQRARVIFYNRDRLNPAELSTYEDLASEKWRGRICIRSSSNIYNQSLVASMIVNDGAEKTETWAAGLVANFARSPAGGDTDQLRAVAAGQCDIAVANTYYYGRLLNSDKEEDRAVADSVGLFWPNQGDRGAHFNVSGAGIARHAKHPESAQKLLEYLVTPEAQAWYAEANNEFPVVPGAKISATLASWGEFKSDSVNLTLLGENNREALQLMDRAGWK